ncbi:twin-arginine translocase TatA/TatE family subunit [Solirubrobacter ginsenosidimutans]|uniref:Sec-independent protein translocase protein TatA n=1 Tax=Solirubrobacter ginsenosidimutans TaxID=490573 RepID=A0A9X3RXZ8_9ACTN|nr:twin-arginine translocase TatA/TatE family subunit [Solirubrobacter ginsenosidimutans]MDA0159105.1 twin-arginine translocase TatA/TatE family subunit [Solirubrobacter ginsenosidimutans]
MELIIVLVIALVVLGPKRLPDAGKSLGRGIREFKGSLSGDTKDDDEREERELAAIQPVAVAEPVAEPERVA